MLNMGELAEAQELQMTKLTKRGSYDGWAIKAVQGRF
jgi:hypothetical protein